MGAALELVGLPGSGKSHVLEQGHLGPGEASVVPSGRVSYEKTMNVVVGVRSRPGLARLALADSLRSGRPLKVASSWLILLERIGRVSDTSTLLDEGPLQAAWGLFFWRPHSSENVERFTQLIDSLPAPQQLVYVSAGQDYASMIALRERTHPSYSAADEDLRRARDWMALLLSHVRTSRTVARYLNRLVEEDPTVGQD